MKVYIDHPPVGKCKHLVSFHDGVKTHRDGTPFFDLRTARNKKQKERIIRQLKREGYVAA